MDSLPWIMRRLEEPSTWAGGGLAAMVISTIFPGQLGHEILTALTAMGAIVAIVLPEKKSTINVEVPENTVVIPRDTMVIKK